MDSASKERKNCACTDDWKCPEHRAGASIPVKSNKKRIGIPPYWKGFLEAMGIMGVLFLVLRVLEQMNK